MKSRLATAGLYAGFFAVAFLLCLFLTFDARIPAAFLQQGARAANIKLSFEQATMSGLFGLELTGVEISPLNQPEARPLTLRRLKLSPSLLSLPGALWDARKKRTPRAAFSFSGWLGDTGQANLGGEVDYNPPALAVDLDLAALPLDQLPPGLIRNFPPLTGKLNGKLRLDIKDRQKPATWDCTLKADLFQAELGEIDLPQMGGMKFPGFNLGNVSLDLDLKGGKGQIKTLRLSEGDLVVDLTGSIALPDAAPVNPGAIRVEVTGAFNMSEDNKKKLPLLAALIPPKGRLNYSGELRAISPMLSAPAPTIPRDIPRPRSNADDDGDGDVPAPNAPFDPGADPMNP